MKSLMGLSSFSSVMAAYKKVGVSVENCLDGGAGAGSTAAHMLRYCTGTVYAFEPFPGNHRFFAKADPRVRLIPSALANIAGTKAFRVSSVVTEDSAWGKSGMAGYSSVGYLTEKPEESDLLVDCVRADDVISSPIDFVKLDLQGGELHALLGMPRIMSECLFMWIEFSGQPGLLPLLSENFELFDTEYMFFGKPSDFARSLFEVSKDDVPLSTDARAWFGYKRTPWIDFEEEFPRYKRELSMVQTDLLCVNQRHLDQFRAVHDLLVQDPSMK